MTENNTGSAAPPGEDTCGVCYSTNDNLFRCGCCKAILYCSRACQRIDWPLHKILCKEFAESKSPEADKDGNIPGGGLGEYRRAIFFHPDETKPRILWLKGKSEENEIIFKNGALTGDVVVPREHTFIARHTRRSAAMARLQKCVENANCSCYKEKTLMIYRDGFRSDGSTANRSLASCVRASGVIPNHDWRGPFLFRRRWDYVNIDMACFRGLVIYLTVFPYLWKDGNGAEQQLVSTLKS